MKNKEDILSFLVFESQGPVGCLKLPPTQSQLNGWRYSNNNKNDSWVFMRNIGDKQMSKVGNCQPSNLYPAKIAFKSKVKVNSVLYK